MRKLWETGRGLDALVEAYTVGEDPALDARLLRYEALGTLAHAAGLAKIGVLTPAEVSGLRAELKRMLEAPEPFVVAREQEDIHTAVEQALTARLGDVGAKVHAGRSRNDQVQVDLRLFMKDRLLGLSAAACGAAEAWAGFGRENAAVPLPGYTHLQRAMPTTVGHWAASHAEALLENVRALRAAYDEADASPLGSAAGYGATLPLDRAHVAGLLGFSRVQRNTLRVQTSRPRVEAAAVSACALLGRDLGALAWDLSLYTTAEFGFFSLAPAFTTGSSLMPQKKNPDVVELTRARAAMFPGWAAQVLALGQLPSGYHRDYQLTKGVLFAALDTAAQMLEISARLPGALSVDRERCRAAITKDMLATHSALALVAGGMPFRSAYRAVADEARGAQEASAPAGDYALPGYAGAPGNPDFDALAADRAAALGWVDGERARLDAAWGALL
ncbi:MAG: argininosuccinate lyase [Elusimicrobia bacterium]|nr:argininosuccinate lyase [Elusimicrobiota bacterium]